jgi:sugar phosphate isomerase/epimerase
MLNTPEKAAPAFAVSTWSLHRRLGTTFPDSPANDVASEAVATYGAGEIALLDLPAEIASHGIDRVEICHFHIQRSASAELAALRAALADAGVELMTLLIDDGDLTDAANHRRDMEWMAGWIDAAAELGARRARVIAGKHKPTPETLALSVEGLRELGKRGRDAGVEVITENWLALLSGPDEVHHVLDRLDGEVGFLADFGNWKGPTKYDDLASIMPRAVSTHCKAHFDQSMALDGEDYGRCLDVAAAAGFFGPHSLIYEGPGDDEWAAIAIEHDFVAAHSARRAEQAA